MKLEFRPKETTDAQRFYEILNGEGFEYFFEKPPTLEEEIEYLVKAITKHETKEEYGYTILADGVVIGGCGIMPSNREKHVVELGYFIDFNYRGKGIATASVKYMEEVSKELGFKRMELYMDTRNIGSWKVAEKSGYDREGILKGRGLDKGVLSDDFIYAKILE